VDDGICPKSSYALGFAKPTQNVTIADCYVTGCWELGSVLDGTYKRRGGGTGRIKCGTESNGGFINIAISNCVFEGCGGLALETVDGALLEDITVTNLTMRDINNCPIFLRLGARLRGRKNPPRWAPCAASSSTTSTPSTPLALQLYPQRNPRLPHRRRQALGHLCAARRRRARGFDQDSGARGRDQVSRAGHVRPYSSQVSFSAT